MEGGNDECPQQILTPHTPTPTLRALRAYL